MKPLPPSYEQHLTPGHEPLPTFLLIFANSLYYILVFVASPCSPGTQYRPWVHKSGCELSFSGYSSSNL